MTRRKDEDYEDFIDRVSRNRLARSVKAADLYDNSDEDCLSRLDESEAARLRAKYTGAIERLRVGEQIERCRNERLVSEIACDSVILGASGPPATLLQRADSDAEFPCSECPQMAARLVLAGNGLTRFGFLGTASYDVLRFGRRPVEQVASAIRSRDVITLRSAHPEFAPFWCRQCERIYCQTHWTMEVTFDDGFYDETYGTCPSGHRHKLDD